MLKNKFWGLAIIAGVIASLLLVVAQIPATHTTVKNLPLAVVNEDNGPVSATMVTKLENFTTTGGKNATTIKWTTVKSTKVLKKAMDHQKYYGALIIKSGFSADVATLATKKPTQPTVNIVINQGKNATIATAVTTLFNKLLTSFNTAIATQVLASFTAQNQAVPATIATNLLQPIKATTIVSHETSAKPTAAASFFQPLWIGSLLAGVMLFLAGREFGWHNSRKRFYATGLQVIIAGVTALILGFSTTSFTTWIMDYHYDNYLTLALYASLAAFAFINLVLGVLSWTGMAGIPLFALMMLFALPILQLAPEMLTYFYKSWVYPWLPMRFLLDGTRGIIYYHASFWTHTTVGLIWVMLSGLLLLVLKNLMPKSKNKLA
ncbi:DUF3533 domain-containing protein [Periweissella cryptocerci]|uniref:DUF3533 domain-containing protein n=1 Tax=Periweissella cryptocerci TaxID=2506420 RepID=A0A4P6YU17_9LACO|nr:DUF3533 domain-containing protein [Periweissella cryptocerci]QBO36196.1 DUF3533 domain-containing protein [Periweissella cryptocerci]